MCFFIEKFRAAIYTVCYLYEWVLQPGSQRNITEGFSDFGRTFFSVVECSISNGQNVGECYRECVIVLITRVLQVLMQSYVLSAHVCSQVTILVAHDIVEEAWTVAFIVRYVRM